MFATYLTLAREACKVVKAHKDGLVDQIAHILSDGVKQGAFQVADVKASARAMFDATSRFHHPAHSEEWSDPQLPARIDAVAGAVAQGPRRRRASADSLFRLPARLIPLRDLNPRRHPIAPLGALLFDIPQIWHKPGR